MVVEDSGGGKKLHNSGHRSQGGGQGGHNNHNGDHGGVHGIPPDQRELDIEATQ